jgi:uncharacterized protein related to proFAR isomerase
MEIIPVIDLKGGLVVRARMGQRDRYRPIETPLSPTSTAEALCAASCRCSRFARCMLRISTPSEGPVTAAPSCCG